MKDSESSRSTSNLQQEANSKLLGFNIKIDNKDINRLISGILSDIKFRKKSDRVLYKKHLYVVLTNLLRCRYKEQLHYSRNKTKGFTKDKRYNPKQLTLTVLIKVIDLLQERGLLINTVGVSSKDKEHRVPSFIQPTDLFLDTFSSLDTLSESVEEKYLNEEECFLLRDDHKSLISYRDTYYTNTGRAVIVGLNSINRSFEYRKGNGELITNHYCRIFNNTFDYGGRFYRAGILNLKNKHHKERLRVTCNNERMIEVDYCNLHILLLTIIEGYQYNPEIDLYNKCIPDGWVNQNTRAVVKVATNIMLNARTSQGAAKAIQSLLEDYLLESPEDFPYGCTKAGIIMQWIRKGHPKLKHHFCNLDSTGLTLMKMDSDMAHHVIHCFVSQEKPILPIHDSFLVRRSDKNDLITAMVEALKTITERDDIIVPLEVEWLDNEVYQAEKIFI